MPCALTAVTPPEKSENPSKSVVFKPICIAIIFQIGISHE